MVLLKRGYGVTDMTTLAAFKNFINDLNEQEQA